MAEVRQVAGLRLVAGLVIGVGVVTSLFSYDRVEVCDDVVTSDGEVVERCRHLELADPPVVAVGVVMLAALGVFFTEISGLGFTLKRELSETRATADQASRQAGSARLTAEVAESVSLETASTANAATTSAEHVAEVIDGLAVEYNAIRRDLPGGDERTGQMTRIVSRMLATLSGVPTDEFDISDHLESPDRGSRLAGYAYLYANPNPLRLSDLTTAMAADDTAFGQYWALRAIRKQLATTPGTVDLNTRRALTTLLGELPPTSDRAYEVRAALSQLDTS